MSSDRSSKTMKRYFLDGMTAPMDSTQASSELRHVFADKFIAFVDILGFKRLVADIETGRGMTLADLLKLLHGLGTGEERRQYERNGGTMCPLSRSIDRNLDFRVTQLSDCVIVSAEVSPAGVINLLSHCWVAAMHLLREGFMCRGYVKRGLIYHSETQVIGTGYQDAYQAESSTQVFQREADERGTPYIEVDKSVLDFIDTESDDCVRKMSSRLMKRSGGTAAIFPFQRLQHQFAVTDTFDPAHEKATNDIVRRNIQRLRERVSSYVDRSNSRAVQKLDHYLAALDDQLQICDRTDEAIDMLRRSFSRRSPC